MPITVSPSRIDALRRQRDAAKAAEERAWKEELAETERRRNVCRELGAVVAAEYLNFDSIKSLANRRNECMHFVMAAVRKGVASEFSAASLGVPSAVYLQHIGADDIGCTDEAIAFSDGVRQILKQINAAA